MLVKDWLLLPVGILIAVLAMSSGATGAAFWVPVYLLWLRFEPAVAFWVGLFTMLFGFGSGTLRNWLDGTIDWRLVRRFAILSVPAALVGGFSAVWFADRALIAAFGAFLILYSVAMAAFAMTTPSLRMKIDFISRVAAVFEGFLTGLISVGTGVFTVPAMLQVQKADRSGVAVGSGVALIFLTSLAGAVGRMRPKFIDVLISQRQTLLSALIWAVPGVIIGGQIGPAIAQRIRSRRYAQLYLAAMLLAIGALTLLRALH